MNTPTFSGLDGFEEAANQVQTQSAFVCVSDIADGLNTE